MGKEIQGGRLDEGRERGLLSTMTTTMYVTSEEIARKTP